MKIGTDKDLRDMAKKAREEGFKFKVYECVWRGHPFIAEISAVKKTRTGCILHGFSYQSGTLRQSQMRRVKEAVKAAFIRNGLHTTTVHPNVKAACYE